MAKQEMRVDGLKQSGYASVPVDLPSNSNGQAHTKKEDPEIKKKVEKVVKGKVTTRKKSLGRKFTETFLNDDLDSVVEYVVHDVLIPAAKNTFSDMVQNGIEMLLFGTVKGSRTNRNGGKSFVSYSSMHNNGGRNSRVGSRADRNRSTHNFDEYVFESSYEAKEVLESLVDLIDQFEEANVADFYDLVGVTGSFTDNKYGWTDLSRAKVVRVRGGWIIDLPRTRVLG